MVDGMVLPYDVLIIGGGPAGLSGALALSRARKRVLLCDYGTRRNAAAVHIQNFVTRDGTPPDEFRRIAREQLAQYPNFEVRDVGIESIDGERGQFRVALTHGEPAVIARRILLATGMVDEPLPIEGFRELWGKSIFQCPYCHGWENRDQRWGFLARPEFLNHVLPFALMLTGWTRDVVVFTNGAFSLPEEMRAQLQRAGVRVEASPITRINADTSVLLANGETLARDVLFTQPSQRQVGLVQKLAETRGLKLDDDGFVMGDPMKRDTSIPGIYASGDLTTRGQSAIFAAASGTQAAAMINVDLSMELGMA